MKTIFSFLLILLVIGNSHTVSVAAIDGDKQSVAAAYLKVFDDSTLTEIEIIIDPTSLDYILAPQNSESDSLFPAKMIFKNSQIPGDTLLDVGFRIRGNTSRRSAKKSFKIDINHYIRGRKFYGLEKINLNGEHNDPAIIRSKLCWDLFNEIGIAASRANHVKLFINDRYFGLYIHVEHIDDEFVQKRFGNQNGNLYKCLYPADLQYLGDDPALYKQEYWGRRAYDLKINYNNDYADLTHFIKVLNQTPQKKFKTEIEKVFNVDGFLKWLSMSVLTGSWDDYWFLKNNYYLYYNPDNQKFEFIPYDYDNSYGIRWMWDGRWIDWAERNIYNWGSQTEDRPLVTRILSIAEYRNQYTQNIQNFIEAEFSLANQEQRINRLKVLITPAVEADSFRTLHYGFSISDFHRAFTDVGPIKEHVPYGIIPYIESRIAAANSQLKFVNYPPQIEEVKQLPAWPELNQAVAISAKIIGDYPINKVELNYKLKNGNFQTLEMFDDGLHSDLTANDSIYGVEIPGGVSSGTVVYYYLEARDSHYLVSVSPNFAPQTCHFYVASELNSTDVLVKFHYQKKLAATDAGIGVLGSFNNWDKIYPMQEIDTDWWEIPCYLAPGEYIYKFVSYQHLEGKSGVTEWTPDPENSLSDGEPYYNSVLKVTDPMIYYQKPFHNDTLLTLKPEISASFACSRSSVINPQAIILKLDNHLVQNIADYYFPEQNRLVYVADSLLKPGKHTVFLYVENFQTALTEKSIDFYIDTPGMCINEFMAKNDSTISDEAGEFDDWVEIFNTGSSEVNLTGLFLTDDLSQPIKWAFPDISLKPGEFLLVWTDNDPEQGSLHTNFKLSASGEQLGLFRQVDQNSFLLDSLSFTSQSGEFSCGRYPDGKDGFLLLPPTPGKSNISSTGINDFFNPAEQHAISKKFIIEQNYPNPFNSSTTINFTLPNSGKVPSSLVSIKIFNLTGQIVRNLVNQRYVPGKYQISWDGQNEAGDAVGSGTYFCQVTAGKFMAIRKMILLR